MLRLYLARTAPFLPESVWRKARSGGNGAESVSAADSAGRADGNIYRRACLQLDTARLEKLRGLKSEETKAQSLCCGLLIQYALREYLGVRKRLEIAYRYGEWGKPYLAEYPGLYFSLSHSGEYAALAFGDCELGVDIQRVRPVGEALAKRTLSETEYRRYRALSSAAEKENWFFRCWCAKESCAKLIGRGLSYELRALCYEAETGRVRMPDGVCRCREYLPAEGYFMNVCLAGEPDTDPARGRDGREAVDVTDRLLAMTGA